ncbi:MAG: ornithine carbamoyltransferase [Deltaproteobacteria bacterium]|jgi:ornithine carbamoyltransferase|nr:ornithine carbamoyltransferase [Deltaproteobacteria bacterium]
MKKDILTLWDLEPEEITQLIDRSIELKKGRNADTPYRPLPGRTLGIIFDKPSTRTRVSFETAMIQLGGGVIFMSSKDTQLIRDEPVGDTARVLSRYVDGIVIRTYSQELVEELASNSSIPVMNGLTDVYHPCQVLSDLQTITEKKGDPAGLKIVWVGDGNNVAHSWINAAAILGLHLVVSTPDGYRPNSDIYQKAIEHGRGNISLVGDPFEAVRDADIIYTDVWASMGQEEEQEIRKKIFRSYQINEKLVAAAKKDVAVMHCLPAHRGEEITGEVLEGRHSVVWDQAENKLHMHKAIIDRLMV